jgi:hypothetical protein
MNRFVTRLIVVAGVAAAAPAYAHGSFGGEGPHGMSGPSNTPTTHETNPSQGKINTLTKDISKDNTRLTADQQKLNTLLIQQAEAKVGKAAPLTVAQQREVQELQQNVRNLGTDINQDNQRLTADQTKQKTWEEQAGLMGGHSMQP